MNLKEELNKIVDEVSGIVTPTIEETEKDYNVDSLLEGLELDSVEKEIEKTVEKEQEQFQAKVELVKESLKPKFLGKFDSKNIPNPTEFPEGTTYRNINEGVVYSRNEQGLWEEFVRDGAPGQTPRSWPSGGGIGVQEATDLINNLNPIKQNNQILSAANSITFSGSIKASNIFSRRRNVKTQVSRMLIEGSSTAQLGGTTQVIFGGVGPYADALSGPITQAIYNGLPVDLIFNGGVGGTKSTQILEHLKSDWPNIAGLCDIIYLQMGASELASINYDPNVLRSNISAAVLWCFNGGKQIVIDIPHMISPSVTPESWYDEHVIWCKNLQKSYPIGVISIVDRYSIISKGNGETPLSLMAADTTPAVHLNCAGAVACRPAYDELSTNLGGSIILHDPYAIGSPAFILNGSNAIINSNSVSISSTSAAIDGRSQWIITSLLDLGLCFINVSGLDVNSEYFIAADYDLVYNPTNSQFVDGIKFTPTSGNQIRGGIYSVEAGGNVKYSIRSPSSMNPISVRFKPGSSTGTIAFYPGGAGWVCLFRWLAIYKVV